MLDFVFVQFVLFVVADLLPLYCLSAGMPPTRRRWFQFGLRTIFVALTTMAVPMSWLGYHLHWMRERHAFAAGLIERRKQLNIGTVFSQPFELRSDKMPFGLQLLGERAQQSIYLLRRSGADDDRLNPARDDEDEIRRARGLFPEASISIFTVTGDGTSRREGVSW
ncbi:MAG TPA: hypothetical protein VGG64_06490 [Pirellulales bacterium]